jgi:hypothetical protein
MPYCNNECFHGTVFGDLNCLWESFKRLKDRDSTLGIPSFPVALFDNLFNHLVLLVLCTEWLFHLAASGDSAALARDRRMHDLPSQQSGGDRNQSQLFRLKVLHGLIRGRNRTLGQPGIFNYFLHGQSLGGILADQTLYQRFEGGREKTRRFSSVQRLPEKIESIVPNKSVPIVSFLGIPESWMAYQQYK